MSERPERSKAAEAGIAGAVAATVALTAYALAIVAGVMAGNPASTVLFRGLVVLVLAHLAGQALGAAGQHVVVQHLRRFESEHPVPDMQEIERSLERQRRELKAEGAA